MSELQNELEESSHDHKKKKTKKKQNTCIFKKTLFHATFVGGLKAGNFTNKGAVTSMNVCKNLCCRSNRCDVAVMMRNGCFLLTCRSKALCKPRKAKIENFTLKLAYRDKEKEQEAMDEETYDEDGNDNFHFPLYSLVPNRGWNSRGGWKIS